MNEKNVTREDKLRSAYALNLCTVSVSQIVDYDDLNILEQEYDAILNNLNLEKIIKDDSLLNILKQILDTITYFKMEDIERKIIDEEYQQQMKNAIWSAVPNFGLIVAGGDPLTMAISLASQVGIGYMNYRRNKNSYAWEKEKRLKKLQQAALEQLNGLRRELFTTAWNLAETYEFPDQYRLSEKQIKQYNAILDDTDPIRKYERLSFIKDNFEAYPPFWYFYGSAANYIANDKTLDISDKTRAVYKEKAKEFFNKYDELDTYNILREDQITASFALEYAELLLAEPHFDKTKIKKLIGRAAKMTPNSYDVLELCAIDYLRIGENEDAARLLKFLVNEDYNKVVNAQLLSGILVKGRKVEEYEMLKTRVGAQYLFPMPKEGESVEAAHSTFIAKQRNVLKIKYSCAIDELISKYSVEWNKINSTFDYSTQYDDSFFANTKTAEMERLESASQIFSQEKTRTAYIDRLKNENMTLCMVNVLNDSAKGLFSLPSLNDGALQSTIVNIVKAEVAENNAALSSLLDKIEKGNFDISDYKRLQDFSLESLYKDIVPNLKKRCNNYVEAIAAKNLSNEEGKLRSVCANEKIPEPEVAIGKRQLPAFESEALPFAPDMFGAKAVIAQKRIEKINEATAAAEDFIRGITLKDETLEILVKGKPEFDGYFNNDMFNGHADVKAHSFIVFHDLTKSEKDIIFSTEGLILVKKGKPKTKTPYNEIKKPTKEGLILYNDNFFTEKEIYSTTALDSGTIYDLIQKVSDKFTKKVSDNIEFIDIVDGKEISAWFKSHSQKFDGALKMVLAYPQEDIMRRFGFNAESNLSPDKHLLQFIYDDKTNYILALRIIEFKNINTNLQASLEENNGIRAFKNA